MPHCARKRGESGYYHVVSKGIANQILFEDDGDRAHYLHLMQEAVKKTDTAIVAYCLMSNHIHLVPDVAEGLLGPFMKYVSERYAMYYAEKTGRTGGIFVKPFWSEAIETDEYLLSAVRYVHANPAVAGICASSAYEWSSARDYLGRGGLTSTSTVLGMLGGRDGFIEFSRQSLYPTRAFEKSSLPATHLTDDEALRVAQGTVGADMVAHVMQYARPERLKVVHALHDAGLAPKQISRATGLGQSFVYRALRDKRCHVGDTP